MNKGPIELLCLDPGRAIHKQTQTSFVVTSKEISRCDLMIYEGM